MFQTFSGNSRRPRQVNLSGRTSNPFAAVQSSSSNNTSRAPGGGSGAIAHAQLERKARQHERDRLTASKKLQRVWRGHRERKELRNRYTRELVESEQRLGNAGVEGRTYEDVWRHLRICVQAVRPSVGDDVGIRRSLLAAHWMCERAEDTVLACRRAGGSWYAVAPLRALARLLMRYLNSALWRSGCVQAGQWVGDRETTGVVVQALVMLGTTLGLLAEVPVEELPGLRCTLKEILAVGLPGQDVLVVEQYFRILGRVCQLRIAGGQFSAQTTVESQILTRRSKHMPSSRSSILYGLLLTPGGIAEKRGTAYEALIIGLLTRSGLPEEVLLCCRDVLDLNSFLGVARRILEGTSDGGQPVLAGDNQALLSNVIYLCNHERLDADSGTVSEPFSVNLAFLSILTQALQNYDSVAELDPSTHEQLKRLVTAENISALFKSTDWITTSDTVKRVRADDAQILADYILTVIRLLPSKADEIRMWIYLSSGKSVSGDDRTALRLFWAAVALSDIFNRCAESPGMAAAMLPRRITQPSRAPGPRKTSDWNIILLFLELYSFALRIQDDEQLVAGLNRGMEGPPAGTNTLNLQEMEGLVTFLKNLSYAIYTERPSTLEDGSGESRTFGNLNGTLTGIRAGQVEGNQRTASTASRSISMSQLKGTVTALLRAIYERDSRRKFLPSKHFIMEELDSVNFINDVLREQELRASLEDDLDESDEDADMPDWDSRRSADQEVMVSSHFSQVQRHTRQAQMRQRQSKRYALQKAAPKSEILENIPFLVPFETRIVMFRSQVENDMLLRREGHIDPDMWRMSLAERHPRGMHRELGAHSAELRRENVFEDAFKAFYKLGEGLKEPIKISFIGEEGIDGGGVTKEFLTSIIDEVFSMNSEHHLFAENDQHELYPYPSALDEIDVYFKHIQSMAQDVDEEQIRQAKREKLQFYEFVGRVVGKCLYEGILVQIPLARFFIAKWALTGGDGASRNESTFRPSINDLRDYDQEIYRSMLTIKNFPDDVKELEMDFTVTDDVGGGQRVERELRPGGSNITVDNANRLIYIALVTKHYLMDRQGPQTRAFLDGLSSIIKPTWLRMFNETEIRTLLGGEAKAIDVEDLRRNTVYGGVYQIGDDGQEHPTIKMFWEVMHEMQDTDRRKLLQYATSTPNAPLMGFSHLNPRFSIRDSMSDQGRLPTSSTCANLLKLPIYQTKQNLRDKIMTAIHSNAGFDLS